jgi:hypothetical protein
MKKNESATHERVLPADRDGDGVVDTTSMPKDSLTTGSQIDSIIQQRLDRPVERPQEQKPATGTAMVYCSPKMIDGIPSIVNATITKDELAAALKEYRKKIEEENPDLPLKEIDNDIKSETIDLYERMGVKVEFDSEVFKMSPKEANITKSFGEHHQLEWEWEMTPLKNTEKSYIHFTFYYEDPADNSIKEIFQKRISVQVKVDNRVYVDKWKQFILGDPKNTTTAIVIPLVTFLGGFLTAKRNKKNQ